MERKNYQIGNSRISFNVFEENKYMNLLRMAYFLFEFAKSVTFFVIFYFVLEQDKEYSGLYVSIAFLLIFLIFESVLENVIDTEDKNLELYVKNIIDLFKTTLFFNTKTSRDVIELNNIFNVNFVLDNNKFKYDSKKADQKNLLELMNLKRVFLEEQEDDQKYQNKNNIQKSTKNDSNI